MEKKTWTWENICVLGKKGQIYLSFSKIILIETHKIGIFILIAQVQKLKIWETIACWKLFK